MCVACLAHGVSPHGISEATDEPEAARAEFFSGTRLQRDCHPRFVPSGAADVPHRVRLWQVAPLIAQVHRATWPWSRPPLARPESHARDIVVGAVLRQHPLARKEVAAAVGRRRDVPVALVPLAPSALQANQDAAHEHSTRDRRAGRQNRARRHAGEVAVRRVQKYHQVVLEVRRRRWARCCRWRVAHRRGAGATRQL